MIVDTHMHIDDIPALGWDMSAEHVVRRMDEAGVDVALVMTIADWPEVNPNGIELLADACRTHKGRLFALARIHPWYGERACAALEHAVSDLGFRGLKLHPVTTIDHPASSSTLDLIRIAAKHDLPTLFHCGDDPLSTPLAIARAAEAIPHATIVLAHMGGYFHVDEAIEVAERLPNLVLETSGMPYPDKVREAVRRVGADRVIYASDGPFCSPRIEVEKIRVAGLSSSDLELVLGENARRLFKLP
jgi:predicted TIM-barrel fold metal-dependent hydrolase